jgi:putative FmdB family regulatory protein
MGMPIYEYRCEVCGEKFEKFVRSISAQVELKCPGCGSERVKKAFSVFGTTSSSSGRPSAASSACSVPSG